MEISVSRLNNRLALQLPAELPLGLVFVVGTVRNLVRESSDDERAAGSRPRVKLELVEEAHRLRCQLTARVAAETNIRAGDKIRAGGHLAFDSKRADYYLLVRDLELIEEAEIAPEETDLPLSQVASASILEDLARHSEKPSLAEAELPDWVQQLAPPEVKARMAPSDAEPAQTAEAVDNAVSSEETDPGLGSSDLDYYQPGEEEDEIVALLSEAMESGEDVEFEPEIFEKLPAQVSRPREIRITGRPYEIPLPEQDITRKSTTPPTKFTPRTVQPAPRAQQADPLMILLLITFIVVIVTAIVIVVMMWMR